MKIAIMDEISSNSIPQLKKVFEELKIVYTEEIILKENLSSAIMEIYYLKEAYTERINFLLKNTEKPFEFYKKEITESKVTSEIEFLDTKLSTYFKSSLVFSKSILDKLVLLYNFRYNGQKNCFESKGKFLKNEVKNKNKSNSDIIVKFIDEHKRKWIDDLLKLRDDFTHHSKLPQYKNFHIMTPISSPIDSFNDLNNPCILINNTKINAVEYLNFIFDNLLNFCSDFLKLTGFNEYYMQEFDFPFKCGICKTTLIEKLDNNPTQYKVRNVKYQITNKKYNHGFLYCECGARVECNLNFFVINQRLPADNTN